MRIKFGKWQSFADDEHIYTRIYWGYRWTPFVTVAKRYSRVELQRQIAVLIDVIKRLENRINANSVRLDMLTINDN